MTTLFDDDIEVHYGFVHLDSGVGGWDEDVEPRAAQRNGLLGAAQPGFLLISTGMHTGLVPLRVEVHPGAPPLVDECDEVVEASCDLRGPEMWPSTFEWATSVELPTGGPHRVRLSARDYESGRTKERHERRQRVRDSYLLQLWPAEMAPDEIIKVTSPSARYWHAQALQHPEAPRSPQDQALAERRERAAAVVEQDDFARSEYLRSWGGRDPSARLLEVESYALALTRRRRDLVDDIAALTPGRQRALAVGLARQVCGADDGTVDWTPALDALAAGQPLPAPFDDPAAMTAALFPPHEVTYTAVVISNPAEAEPDWEPLHVGVSADATVRAAAAVDPLEAALQAVDAASWSAPDVDAFFAGVAEAVRGLQPSVQQ